jgi:hypothetical protein
MTPVTGWEASMRLEMIISVAIGLWLAVMLLVVSLCRASNPSDEAADPALANAKAGEVDTTGLPPSGQPLRTLSLDRAATLLGVTPHTLLEWDARYGFPTSSSLERRYNQAEVLALRESLADGLSIASAVTRARERSRHRRGPTAPRLIDHRDGGLAS